MTRPGYSGSQGPPSVRILPPGKLLAELEANLAAAGPQGMRTGRRVSRRFGSLGALVGAGILLVALGLPAFAASFDDSGTVNVQVADKTGAVADATRRARASSCGMTSTRTTARRTSR